MTHACSTVLREVLTSTILARCTQQHAQCPSTFKVTADASCNNATNLPGKPMLAAPDVGAWARCCMVTAVFPWVASRSRTPAKLQYEPRVDTLQHGYEYTQINNHVGPTGYPRKHDFLRNVEPRSARVALSALRMPAAPHLYLLTRRRCADAPLPR